MWFNKFNFFDIHPGLTESIPDDFFTKPYSVNELEILDNIRQLYPEGTAPEILPIPKQIKLPEEYIKLLNHSNGGGILNGDREFGYFSLEDIREMYISYGFPFWAPAFLPVAFNGGGKFYAYDLRKENEFPIIAVSSGNIGYDDDCWGFLGNTMENVLSNTNNIEDELD
ncbi:MULTISPECIES: SMI1/KNR4 family protein [Flavobacterium]|uniref:SMI1/KNR4 family protein n=1 Tax=Flavobacterium endoglycinae TaxID=2816357 RepID=A0ABX7QCI9_9FLAO|nr:MULTISPECIES: SMI1/KNR4 family protein [Flavobacterium]QSW88672.1 SMI1/KNR4 family protein [Flavobacterium endoglycinae]